LCLVRRQRPRTGEAAKKMLVSARGLVCAQSEAPESLRDVLTTTRIEQYLRHLGAKNASNQRTLLMHMMADAHGLPTARSRRRQDPPTMSAAVEDWMRQCESGVPMREVLGNGCTRDSLRALTPHLPAGDIPAFREVLRG
jgi:hypothetical protein